MTKTYVKVKDTTGPEYKAVRFLGELPSGFGIICKSTGRSAYGGDLMQFYLPVKQSYEPINVGDYIVTTLNKHPKVYAEHKFLMKFMLKEITE